MSVDERDLRELERRMGTLETSQSALSDKVGCMDKKLAILKEKMDSVYRLFWLILAAVIVSFIGLMFAFFTKLPGV